LNKVIFIPTLVSVVFEHEAAPSTCSLSTEAPTPGITLDYSWKEEDFYLLLVTEEMFEEQTNSRIN